MNLHGVPGPVVTAALDALVRQDLSSDDDSVFVSAVAAMIAAALAELPREECRRSSHQIEILSSPDGTPRWLSCGRCNETWSTAPMDERGDDDDAETDAPTAPAPQMTPSVSAPTSKPAISHPPTPAPAKTKVSSKEPVRIVPRGARPVNRPGPPVSPPESETTVPRSPSGPPLTDTEPAGTVVSNPDGDDDGDELPTCESCGNQLESLVFAGEVDKAFKHAVLCRDCLLTCETCGSAIAGNDKHGALDQAKLSFVRWRNRLCLSCHSNAGSPQDAAAGASA